MTMQKEYLLSAPPGESNPLGRALLSNDLVSKLQTLNPAITLQQQFPPDLWWPGKDWADTDWGVKTCLWVGLPGEETSQKISSIHLGAIPEYTQVGPDGQTIVKGWRQILEKVIKSGAVERAALEQAFGVTLAYDDESLMCRGCAKAGRRRKHNGGLLRLCKLHDQVVSACRAFLSAVKEGDEAVAEFNASTQRRLKDVDVQVRGESQVGWSPAGQQGEDRGPAAAHGGVRG